eukprot:2823011-Rhodomonas_salina.1
MAGLIELHVCVLEIALFLIVDAPHLLDFCCLRTQKQKHTNVCGQKVIFALHETKFSRNTVSKQGVRHS